MTIRLNGSTSGYTEIDAPAVAGSNTLLLPTGAGSAYQVMRNGATAGSLEFTDKIVSGTAQASTSGTSIDFTGIPSWVKRVTVMFDQVSTNGTSNPIIQLGTSGGIQATNYRGLAAYVTGGGAQTATQITTGFVIWNFNNTAAAVGQGSAVFNILDSATGIWTMQSCTARSDTNWVGYAAGSKTLSGTLDRVRITTVNGTDTFDAGSINILYE
jgi:hypothetical protein